MHRQQFAMPAIVSPAPTRVLHLIDDAGMGGVSRILKEYLPRLAEGLTHHIAQVAPGWRLPAAIRPDVVVVHFTLNWRKLPLLLSLRRQIGAARLVLVEHSYTEAYERLCVASPRRFRTMLRLAYRMANDVVAVSHGQARWMQQAGLVDASRLIVIPNACDAEQFESVAPLSDRAGPLRLGAYGRYAPQKGFDLLVAAMRLVPPSVATLTLAGAGPDHAALLEAAQGLSHVSIGGPIEKPRGFLEGIQAVIVPSRWEAFGLVAAEARAAGRPVLTAAIDGLIEQVGPGCGSLGPLDTPERIASAIIAFAERDTHAMGAAARRSVAGAFEATIAGWAALLRPPGVKMECTP